MLILFVAYQVHLGEKSFWSPYLDIVGDADLPHFWAEHEWGHIHDTGLKQTFREELEMIEDDYEYAFEIIQRYKHLVNPEKFTFDVFKKAYSMVMTRSFGWNVPFNMLVPFADLVNHHCVESYHQLFNTRLQKSYLRTKVLQEKSKVSQKEKFYFIGDRKKTKFFTHFWNDTSKDEEEGFKLDKQRDELEYDAVRYFKKLKFRDEIEAITAKEFIEDEKY